MKYPVLLSVSDMHLSHSPPPCRAKEENWYEAMKRHLIALKKLQRSLKGDVPIAVAGDIFDKWNPPHELVNFALANLPHIYAVPGQHDLPHHSYSDIKRSAYWTLVEAGKICNLEPNKPVGFGEIALHGFPWGTEICNRKSGSPLCKHIAIVHAYVFTNSGNSYPDAPVEQKANRVRRKLKGFDLAIFGDNHKGFISYSNSNPNEPKIVNNGSFMRTRSDQEDYVCKASVVYSDGSVDWIPLECEEVFNKVESRTKETHDFSELINGLSGLSEVSSDFKLELQRELNRRECSPKVRKIVWQAVGE